MNVKSMSFDVQIQEWAYLDGPHTTERISWLVAEAGHHTLIGGAEYEAGTKKVGGSWNCVNFEKEIQDPVMFSQIVTDEFQTQMVTRMKHLDSEGFQFKL